MIAVLVLASELKEKTLWNPTLLGWLVFISAIVLFLGSIYLLLATNLGARLGFLVAGAGIFGLLVLMTGLWSTTAYPLNTLRGALPGWKPVAITEKPGDMPTVPVAVDAIKEGKNLYVTPELRAEYANMQAAAQDVIISKAPVAGEEQPLTNFQKRHAPPFTPDSPPVIGAIFEVKESQPWPFKDTRWSIVEFCPAADGTAALGDTPSKCDPTATRYLVMKYDYGSLRVPPLIAFFLSCIGFVLFLLGLHWRERDERAAAQGEESPAVKTPVAAGR